MAKKPAAKKAAVPVEARKHVADARPNIPTRETAPFADDAPQRFVEGTSAKQSGATIRPFDPRGRARSRSRSSTTSATRS